MAGATDRGWLGGPGFIKLKRWANGAQNARPTGRTKTRMYYSGRRHGPPTKKHEGQPKRRIV